MKAGVGRYPLLMTVVTTPSGRIGGQNKGLLRRYLVRTLT